MLEKGFWLKLVEVDWNVRALAKALFWKFVGNLREESGEREEMVAAVRWAKTEEMVVAPVVAVGAEAAIWR